MVKNQTPNAIVTQKWFPIAKTCYSETTNKARSLLFEALKGVPPDTWSKKRSLVQTSIKKKEKKSQKNMGWKRQKCKSYNIK